MNPSEGYGQKDLDDLSPMDSPERFYDERYKRDGPQRHSHYRFYAPWLRLQRTAAMINSMDGIQRRKVLDIGCGDGMLLSKLNVRRATGIDISERIIDLDRKQYPQYDFEVGNACGLRFDDGTFDLTIMCEVIEHVNDPGRALAEDKGVCP